MRKSLGLSKKRNGVSAGNAGTLDLLQKSIPFALRLSKGARRKGSSALRQAQGERNDDKNDLCKRSIEGEGIAMTFSIKKKLGGLIGILLLLFLILGAIVSRNLRTVRSEIHAMTATSLPLSSLAYDMDIEVLRVAYSILGYLHERSDSHLQRFDDSRKNFTQLRDRLKPMLTTDNERALDQQIGALYKELDELGAAMISRSDQQEKRFESFEGLMREWETLINESIRSDLRREADVNLAYKKLEAISALKDAFIFMQRSLKDYLITHEEKSEEDMQLAWLQFEQTFAVYESLALSAQERIWVQDLKDLAGNAKLFSQEILRLKRQNTEGLADIVALRRKLGNEILYDRLIKGIAEKGLLDSGTHTAAALEAASRSLLIALFASLAFGLIVGLALAYNITSRLTHVVNAAKSLSNGDLSVELREASGDEIGELVTAFQQMIAYIRNVAHVSETVAAGDLRGNVTPLSEQDVLNHSFKKMIAYLQGIAAVTERVSEKDLHAQVVPKSDADVLSLSLAKMVTNLRAMMTEIEQQSWLKDGISQLSMELSGDVALKDVCQKAMSFVAHYVKAGSGALYAYNNLEGTLRLLGAFAFTERSKLSNVYRLGEGVVGQVALERAPILLKHQARQDALISTGTVSYAAAQTYTFPLLYENTLYGVIELAAAQPFEAHAQNFLNEANRVIATVLFSTQQREKVQELLTVAQQAQQAAEVAAQEAEQAKEEAQEQAREVRQANARLEEQQQKLQQQSEELQQVNSHLEEQQQQLHQQSEELRQQNDTLNKAKGELDHRAKELELASKYKSEFLANMSHELRTPLNSIILLSKMLSKNERTHLDEKEVKQVSVINQAGEELLRLINDILDLSKIEAGKMTVNITEFSVRELFQTFKDLFHSIANEKGLEFIVREDIDAILKTDRDKLSQIIRNLLSNAFKFTKQGSVTLAASIHPARKDTILIAVSDTGVGIPKEKQMIVFEAFQQADGSISREFGGTGLGLSIAREYAKLLQGSLALESEVGKGTTFTITLPVLLKELATSAPQPKPEPAAPKPQPMPAPVVTFSASSSVDDDRQHLQPGDKVILIVEDNADLAQSTMDVTKEMGFKVLVALTGRDGLELAAKYRPTGILLDLVLPDINGMEVLRELKSTRELRHIPVHIFSSKERDNSYRTFGAVGYYQKPVNEIDIQHAVENLMTISEKFPKRLLVVEDDQSQREAIQEFLGNTDEVKITGVSSQNEAIQEIETGEYDAAIIDLGLKDGNGYDICRYIKERHVKLPVIIYTGRELTEEQERELRKYTDSIIIKTAKSYERLSDETALFLHQMYHGEHEAAPRHAAPRPLETQGSLVGKKILIVDDDVKNVFVLASALENHGATVVDAKNGQAAIDRLHQEPDIDIVLMDVMMPVMDGYTAMRLIRKDEQLKHLPIIALTAKALKEDRQKCIQAGADDYLSKPVDYDGLIRLVKAWIEKE